MGPRHKWIGDRARPRGLLFTFLTIRDSRAQWLEASLWGQTAMSRRASELTPLGLDFIIWRNAMIIAGLLSWIVVQFTLAALCTPLGQCLAPSKHYVCEVCCECAH